jgi:hypothetical protein
MSYYSPKNEDKQLAVVATAWLIAFVCLAYILLYMMDQ